MAKRFEHWSPNINGGAGGWGPCINPDNCKFRVREKAPENTQSAPASVLAQQENAFAVMAAKEKEELATAAAEHDANSVIDSKGRKWTQEQWSEILKLKAEHEAMEAAKKEADLEIVEMDAGSKYDFEQAHRISYNHSQQHSPETYDLLVKSSESLHSHLTKLQYGLSTGKSQKKKKLGGSANAVYKETLEDGIEVFTKPSSGVDRWCAEDYGCSVWDVMRHEVAASKMAELMKFDLVPPTTYRIIKNQRNNFLATTSERKYGSSADAIPIATEWRKIREENFDEAQVTEAAFYDSVVGNLDRHSGNFLVKVKDGKCTITGLIDHGFSFPDSNSEYVNRLNVAMFNSKSRKLTDKHKDFIDKMLKSEDCLGMSDHLSADELSALRDRLELMKKLGTTLTSEDFIDHFQD